MEVHIVQKGDTLWKISRQYNLSFEELKKVNAHLGNPDYIVPGMKIFLPRQKKEAPVPTHHGKKESSPTIPAVEKKETAKTGPSLQNLEEKAPHQQVEQPIPMPKAPKITSKPIPDNAKKPTTQEEVKATVPKHPVSEAKISQERQPVPHLPPAQEHQMPQSFEAQFAQQPMIPMQVYPFMGIPCGWMPIFDADCYAHPYLKPMEKSPSQGYHRVPNQLHVPESSHSDHKKMPVKEAQQKKDEVFDQRATPYLAYQPLTAPPQMPNIESSSFYRQASNPEKKIEAEHVKGRKQHGQAETRPQQDIHVANPLQVDPSAAYRAPSYSYPHMSYPMPQAQPVHPFCLQCQRPIQQPFYYMQPSYQPY